ncbi:hypothetical protein RH915_10895 [Serpentinicella sp. ANB-PHB4]|uniref:hypothetical protein n=1 Tax=Serpentinicella sp. ANB-PHB4 TaxID=3074076 RepID=UPI0028588FB6|nr:hypothetical protein [Serpentinicella sp. ANB-PHB4]MDR5659996.1 hypothetical protein [Serpentinicella sp. ANB-PHB4]
MDLVVEKENDIFQVILNQAVRVPGVRINRTEFLKTTLSKHFQEDIVNLAIKNNPAQAGITTKELDSIAKSCIGFETSKVTAISTAAGVPGKFGAVVAIPADLTQYFAHVTRILQKLIYLYGWKDIFNQDDGIDDETLSLLTIFIGTMFGVQAANTLIQKLAAQAAVRANKVIAAKPLTKGVVYPIVKRIAITISGKMNKKIFASGISKMIPIVGAVTSGGLTFVTFRPMAKRLKAHLETLPTADVNFYKNEINIDCEENIIDVSDIQESDFDISDN